MIFHWAEHEEIIFQFKKNMKNNKTSIFKHIDSLYEIVGDKNILSIFCLFPLKIMCIYFLPLNKSIKEYINIYICMHLGLFLILRLNENI